MPSEPNRDAAAIERTATHRYNDALEARKYRLANGLSVIYLHDPQAPIFSYQTWIRVGSRHERVGRTGMAHLFEHLMFKETANTPEGVFDRTLESFGARINAGTWLDWTYYYEDVPSAHLEEVARLEADRMEHMILSERQLEAEREVVVNERLQRVDNDPGGKLREVLWATALDTHPYRHPTIGWMADIEAISLQDCLAFYKTYYSPNNATIVVVGDVDEARLLDAIGQRYGHMERQAVPKVSSALEPRQRAVRRAEERLAVAADRVVMGYRAPGINDPGFPALEVLNEILAGGDTARFQRALVTDGEVASDFGAFVPPYREEGLFELAIDVRAERTGEQAEQVVLDELSRVCEEGVTPPELRKALIRLETGFYQGLQTAQQKAQGLGFWEVTGDDFSRLFTVGDRYKTVTLEDVQAVAKRVFRPENRTVVIGRPLQGSARK